MSAFPKTRPAIEGFMIDNNDNKPILVLINSDKDKRQVQFYAKDSWWYAELLADSVSTIIL